MAKYKTDLPLDCPERTLFHRDIILNKKPLYELYQRWYSLFLEEARGLPPGLLVELGSGGGFLKRVMPSVICSDVIELPTNDMTFSALEMPFADQSVSGIFMVDTMHHIPDSARFLEEVRRVLVPGGKMVLIEPANTLWGRFIYRNFHHEPFDPQGGWTIPPTGPLSGANGALPWIVFIRDIQEFRSGFPDLSIESIEFRDPLSYLFTGGVSHKPFLPGFLFPMVRLADRILPRLSAELSMFMAVKVRKI